MFSELDVLITKYKESSDRVLFKKVLTLLTLRCNVPQNISLDEEPLVRKSFAESARLESSWAVLIGEILWHSGFQKPTDFLNIWNCTIYAGFRSKYSRIDTSAHLAIWKNLKETCPSRAVFLAYGNSLRHLHKYSAAEDAYLEGIYNFPDDPFLKMRLADLYLATYKLHQAQQILLQLKALYPYAREMMFISSMEERFTVPKDLFPSLTCGNRELVCFIAADPIYTDKFALNYARSISEAANASVHFHFHVIHDDNSTVSAKVFAELNTIASSLNFTHRRIGQTGSNPNWRTALFSSERFLMLAEIIAKYRKPVLMTDIDIEFLKNPLELLSLLSDCDFGFTNFRDTTEAWERYAATVLIVRPTDAAISFFRRMGNMILTVLSTHPQPWFVDQIVLFRLMEEVDSTVRTVLLKDILTDTNPPSVNAYFRILHASWE